MKCFACDYAYEQDYISEVPKGRRKERDVLKTIKGDVDFIRSDMKITYHDNFQAHTIFICPKCGTLRINI